METYSLKLSDDERESIEERAEQAGLTRHAYMRDRVLSPPPPPSDDAELREFYRRGGDGVEGLEIPLTRALATSSGSGANVVGEGTIDYTPALSDAEGFLMAGVPIRNIPGSTVPDYHGVSSDGELFDLTQWNLAEGTQLTDQSGDYGSEIREQNISPVSVTARIPVSRKLMVQSDAPMVLRDLIWAAFRARWDERVGKTVAASSDVFSRDTGNSTDETVCGVSDIMDALATVEIDPALGAFVMTPKVRSKFAKAPVVTSSDRYMLNGRWLMGLPAWCSMGLIKASGAEDIYFGDWANAVEVLVWPETGRLGIDQYSGLANRQVEVVGEVECAIRICRPKRLLEIVNAYYET